MHDTLIDEEYQGQTFNAMQSDEATLTLLRLTSVLSENFVAEETSLNQSLDLLAGRQHFMSSMRAVSSTRKSTLRDIQAMVEDNYMIRRTKTTFELLDEFKDSLPMLQLRKSMLRVKA